MWPLYAVVTGSVLAWFNSKPSFGAEGDDWSMDQAINKDNKCDRCRKGGKWRMNPSSPDLGVLCYPCSSHSNRFRVHNADDDWEYNIQPMNIQDWALGYGVDSQYHYSEAEQQAYNMAYNDGHSDGRNKSGYQPIMKNSIDRDAFREAYKLKLRAESEVISGDNKGKVISTIGSDPRLKSELVETPTRNCLFCGATSEDSELVEIMLEGYTENMCEHCMDPNNWDDMYGAEDWSQDSDGMLARALKVARSKKQKPLTITNLIHKDQKTLDEFNGAVVWNKPKGIVDKVMKTQVGMQEVRLNEAILELEQYIRLGMITEEDAFKKIVAMSR